MSSSAKKKILCVVIILVGLFLLCFISLFGFLNMQKNSLHTAPSFGTLKTDNAVLYKDEKYKYNDKLINILVLGIDKKGTLEEEHERGGIGQADAIFLVSFDTEEKSMKILCIPRDSMVSVQRFDKSGKYYDTQTMQLSLQYAFGDGREKSGQLTAQAVADLLYQIPISRYCAIDLRAIQMINDAIGGVDVTVKDDFTWYTDKFPQGSVYHLQGDDVMEYLQVRDTSKFATSMGRLERQKGYIDAFLPTAKQALKENPLLAVRIMEQLSPYMDTDMNKGEIFYLSSKAAESIRKYMEFCTIPGEVVRGEKYEEYHVDDEKLYDLIVQQFYIPAE